jgi:hypothetical protein
MSAHAFDPRAATGGVARLKCVCAAAAALVCAIAGPAAAGDYNGQVRALMPTPKEIGFTQLLAFKPAKKPATALTKGWKSGVGAIYAKGTTKAPVEAAATVYVYASAANAKSASQHACKKCPHMIAKGIQMRYAATKTKGIVTVQTFMVCRNVYANTVTTGAESPTKLASDAGLIGLAIFNRAAHFGMTACK